MNICKWFSQLFRSSEKETQSGQRVSAFNNRLAVVLEKHPAGRFRMARKHHKCDYRPDKLSSRRCGRSIGRSTIYFDPRIAKDLRQGHYETLRWCPKCVGLPVVTLQADLFYVAPVESRGE